MKDVDSLDLEPIIIKGMDADEGYGWTQPLGLQVAAEYLKYLWLCRMYPDADMVPSGIVDDFWHLHILDTRKYAEDCQTYFGYFLHHFPYFGMRGEEDKQYLADAWVSTLNRYRVHFGEPPADLWIGSRRCPNCGRRCKDASASQREKRPSFESLRNFTP